MRIAFIGAGNYTRTHIGCLKKIKGVQITGICSRTLATAQAAAGECGAEAFDRTEKMLDTIKPDVLFICLIPGAHGKSEMLAAERKIPFLVEKPVNLNMEQAMKIAEKIKQNRLITAVGYQWRYLDLVEKTRSILAGQKIILAQGYWLSKAPRSAWWHDPALSGGQITEQATHMLDLARYLLGEAEEVHAVMAPPAEGSKVPAATVLTIRFAGNIPATMACACALSVRYRCGLVVHTAENSIELLSVASGMMNIIMTVRNSGGEQIFKPGNDAVLKQDEAFLEAVRTGNPALIRSDYADAVKSLALSAAANESERTRKIVYL